jgi:sortase A
MSYTLALMGMVFLSYWAYLRLDAAYHQWKYEREFREQRSSEESQSLPEEPVVGRIEIPRLAVSAMVLDGVDDVTLRRAVGRVPGTGKPGKPGNIVLAGHRDTFFAPLRGIRKKDEVYLETTTGAKYRYVVESTKVVGPRETSVLASSKNETLTLVTCYPFDFVGDAPKRFIVKARQVADGARQQASTTSGERLGERGSY